jgi:hypothetical protein
MSKKKNWKSPQIQPYPSTNSITPDDSMNPYYTSRAVFMVYEIQNGYLLRPDTRDEASSKLIYCKSIPELTEQILSAQAQMRLNFK